MTFYITTNNKTNHLLPSHTYFNTKTILHNHYPSLTTYMFRSLKSLSSLQIFYINTYLIYIYNSIILTIPYQFPSFLSLSPSYKHLHFYFFLFTSSPIQIQSPLFLIYSHLFYLFSNQSLYFFFFSHFSQIRTIHNNLLFLYIYTFKCHYISLNTFSHYLQSIHFY